MPDHEIVAESLSAGDAYRLMTDLIAPRPIAWVSTLDGDGVGNLAPFSYYQAVCSRPPTVILSFGWMADGKPKNTLANILATGELTINHVGEPLAEAMNASSAAYAPEVSEWDALGIEGVASRSVRPPRVAAAVAALECRLQHAIPLGETRHGTPSSTVVIARVVHFHVRDGLIEHDERGRLRPIDPARLAAVGRLGGIAYTRCTDSFEIPRPKIP